MKSVRGWQGPIACHALSGGGIVRKLVRVKGVWTCLYAAFLHRVGTEQPDGAFAADRDTTLAVLGFGQPRKVIIDQLAVVQSLAQGSVSPPMRC